MIRNYFHISKIAGSLTMLLALASCATEDLFDSTILQGGQTMSLRVVTTDKAETRITPGDDNLNENRFVALDYYFFAENNDNELMKLHKSEGVRLASGNTTLDISSHTYNGRLSDEDIIAIWGSSVESGNCYVYVLANLFTDTRTEINAASNLTLGNLKQFSFQDTNISANAKQECFVMFGGGMVSLTSDATTGVKTISGNPIKVTRNAAKVELTVTHVEPFVETIGADGETVVEKWKSMTDNMWVMFYEGVNKSNVHSQINIGLHYLPDLTDPNEDCYFDLTSKNGLWRKLTAINSNTPNEYLKHEFPFYTYLADWREESGYEDHPSYMILVVPWQQVDPVTNEPVAGETPRYTYYQIKTSDTDTYYENYYYRININVGVLGSFELPEPKEIEGTYMIVPWRDVDVNATMREPIYLIVESNHYTMNNVSTGSVPYLTSHNLTQAYVSKVEYLNTGNFNSVTRTGTAGLNTTFTTNTYVNNESFQVSTADGKVTLTHNISPNQYTRYDVTVVITNEKGLSEEIVFTIYPAIYVSIETGGDAFVNGRFAHVYGAAGGPWYGNGGYNWYTNNQTFPNSGYITTGYGSLRFDLGSNNVTNQSLTRITVTSFNEDDSKYTVTKNNTSTQYAYKLADPRVVDASLNSNLTNYIITADANRTNYNQHTASWADKASIKRGSNESDLIAPDFLISSAWGRTQGQNAQSFQTFERRCATYQEAGYPAGRWRIPTEAELAYIFRLQQLGVIPNLFQVTSGNAYWASSGWAINGYNNGVCSFTNSPNVNGNNTAGVRCVYDVWYWGEEKMSRNEYHAEPSK